MKKKFLCLIMALCLALGGLAAFAGCSFLDSGTDPAPSTAPEYVEWLLRNLKITYNISGGMSDYDYYNEPEPETGVQTAFSGYVTKNGDVTSSSVHVSIKEYYHEYYAEGAEGVLKSNNIGEEKIEYIKNGEDYSIKVYDDSKKVAAAKSVSKQKFIEEGCKSYLPEAILTYLSEKSDVQLKPNTAPAKYAKDGMTLSEDRLKDFTLLTYYGSMPYDEESYNSMDVDVEVVVYQNQLSSITCIETGMDVDDNEFYHIVSVSYDNIKTNPKDVFSKTGYYSSEEECATVMLSGVFDNMPARFRVTRSVKSTIGSDSYTSNYYYAYEEKGDTAYYYEGHNDGSTRVWTILESYTKNGNGHIGRKYNSGDMTYVEKTCDENLCASIDGGEDEHTWINVEGTSFLRMAEIMAATENMQVEFDKDGVCTVSITQQQSGSANVTTKISFVIEGTVLKKYIITMETDLLPDTEIPGFDLSDLAGQSMGTVETYTYTYDTAAIEQDLSGYTKAQ